jgi:hypothetical protein
MLYKLKEIRAERSSAVQQNSRILLVTEKQELSLRFL